MGELAGTYGNGRRMVQTFCASVLQVPISLGAIQKVLDRVTQAIDPYYAVIARQARQAPVNYIDETPWYCRHTLEWLWVMASEQVAFYMIHPRRSKEAFAALIDDWEGLLVSDGYGVYQSWVQARQTCLAHLIRTARSLAARDHPDLAACGAWALAELQRLCHMATAPPTGGEWRAWYARLCKLIEQYHDRQDDAGRFARRLLREMDSLWVFLAHHGVEPPTTGPREPCGLVSSGGSALWAQPVTKAIAGSSVSCRSRRPAVSRPERPTPCWWTPSRSFFQGQQPDLSWINAGVSASAHPL